MTVLYFRSRWSLELQPRPGPFPALFGMGRAPAGRCRQHRHLPVPRAGCWHAEGDSAPLRLLQAIGWAIGIDTLVLEVLKNRVLILMRNFAVAHDEKVELEKSNLQRVDPASLYGRGKALPADADSEMGGGAPLPRRVRV